VEREAGLGGGLVWTLKKEPGNTPRARFLRRSIWSVSEDEDEDEGNGVLDCRVGRTGDKD
jgi:uncharacterized protein YndB with AHSA1/START domain